MKNIKLTLEYDGAGYAGWQSQPEEKTLQDTLEAAIKRVSGEDIRVTASGRTDAGVHAYAQVASFRTGKELDANEWKNALNHFLPDDLRVLEAGDAPEWFDARKSARGKLYEYVIHNSKTPSPLMRNRVWHIGYDIDCELMRQAAAHLLGRHDFTSFQAAGCSAQSPVRELRRLDVSVEFVDRGRSITFSLEATAFLRHMVRNIVGTLVEVGRGYMKPGDVKEILKARDRTKAGPTAPPQGLYLVKVYY